MESGTMLAAVMSMGFLLVMVAIAVHFLPYMLSLGTDIGIMFVGVMVMLSSAVLFRLRKVFAE